MCKIRISIADDHKMVRDGIIRLLELDSNFVIVGQSDDGLQCIEMIKEVEPDILLLDINMPKANGLDVLKSLKELKSTVKVIVLTIHSEIEFLIKAYKFGVKGYVLKDSELAVLREAIYSVYKNETYIQENLKPMLQERLLRGMNTRKDEVLTEREIEVLRLIAKGLINKEIASELSISEKTVKNHAGNIFKKIDVSDRTQAAVYAIKHNYVQI